MTQDILQPERTLLAWRRTSLAVAIAFAVAARLLFEFLGGAAVVLGLVGIGLAIAGYRAASLRYRRLRKTIDHGADLPAAGGGLALLAGSLALLGVGALAFVIWLANVS